MIPSEDNPVVSDKEFQICLEIIQERIRQVELGHTTQEDETNAKNDWVAYITSYAGRAAETYKNFRTSESFRSNMIKVAALALAAIEDYDAKVERATGTQVAFDA